MRCNNTMPFSLFTNIAFQLVFYDSLLGEAVKVQQALTAAFFKPCWYKNSNTCNYHQGMIFPKSDSDFSPPILSRTPTQSNHIKFSFPACQALFHLLKCLRAIFNNILFILWGSHTKIHQTFLTAEWDWGIYNSKAGEAVTKPWWLLSCMLELPIASWAGNRGRKRK